MKNIKIYFTSDIHGYIYPTDYTDNNKKPLGLLNIIHSFNKDENTLIIDAGDTIQGSPFTTYLSRQNYSVNPIAEVMNRGGYDYITLGNHDFNYGYDYLKSYINNLDAKCLSTNIIDKTNDLNITPYDIKTLQNGLKVGIIGFSTDFISTWEREENLENFIIKNTFTSIIEYHDKLKKEVDILIGIYHGGFENDICSHEELSNTSENIGYKICKELEFDILLTGHQHMNISGEYLFGTYIVQAPNYATNFVELNAYFDEADKLNIHSVMHSVNLNTNKELYDHLMPIETKVQNWLDKPVGFLDIELQPTTHLDMAINGSYLANFINTIQLEVSKADISSTSFANSIKGFNNEVTIRDIVSTYIYPNTLVVLEVTAKELKLALEKSASYFKLDNDEIKISDSFLYPKLQHYNYDYFSNIEYIIDVKKEVGSRVTSIKFNGSVIKDDDIFTLVVNNYRATGSGGYEFLNDCKKVKEILIEMPEIIINYFNNNHNIIVDKSKYYTVLK